MLLHSSVCHYIYSYTENICVLLKIFPLYCMYVHWKRLCHVIPRENFGGKFLSCIGTIYLFQTSFDGFGAAQRRKLWCRKRIGLVRRQFSYPLPSKLVLHIAHYRVAKTCKLQVIFRRRATNYTALLQKMTYQDKASYDSTPPCMPDLSYWRSVCSGAQGYVGGGLKTAWVRGQSSVGITPSGTALRQHRRTLFEIDMSPKGGKKLPAKFSLGITSQSLSQYIHVTIHIHAIQREYL